MNSSLTKFIDRYVYIWKAIFILLAVFGLGFFMMGASVQFSNQTEKETISTTESVRTSLQYSAVAQNNTSIFEKGDRLVASPLYVQNVHPKLSLNYSLQTERETDYNTTVLVQYEGVEQGFSFWSESTVIESYSSTTNSTVNQTAEINMTAVRNRALDLRESFRQEGTIEINIVVRTEYETQQYSGTTSSSSDVIFTQSTYAIIPPEDTQTGTHTVTRIKTVEDSIYMDIYKVGGLLVFLSLIPLFLSFLSDRNRVLNDYILLKYSDWITPANQIDINNPDTVINISTASEMVDVAADMGQRLFWDSGAKEYIVVDGSTVVIHRVTDEELKTVRGTKPPDREITVEEGEFEEHIEE